MHTIGFWWTWICWWTFWCVGFAAFDFAQRTPVVALIGVGTLAFGAGIVIVGGREIGRLRRGGR
jgi:hypothetical protein